MPGTVTIILSARAARSVIAGPVPAVGNPRPCSVRAVRIAVAVGIDSEGEAVAGDSNKTTATNGDVGAFVDAIDDEQRRRDAKLLVDLMGEVTSQPAVLWGSSIIGFGSRHYRYPSGREGDTVAVGFSPRKAQTAVYLTGALEEYDDLLARLGPHQTGQGCLYLKRVDQANADALRDIIARSYRAATSI
jgi:hypothetical protein